MQPDHETPPLLAFGPFALDMQRRLLLHAGHSVALGVRDMDLLLALVAQAGQVVSRATLEATLWPGKVVEDSSLRARIAGLRKVLGDGGDGAARVAAHGAARYIVNVPGRGYSFVAALAPSGGGHELPRAPAAALVHPAQVPHLQPGA